LQLPQCLFCFCLSVYLQEKVDISVYFKYEITEEEVLDFRRKVVAIPEVKEVDYVSQEQALQDFIARHQNDTTLIESVQEVGINPFLASLNIRAWEPSQYGRVSEFLQNPQLEGLIEKVDYFERKAVIDKISAFTAGAGRFGILLFAVSIILAILVTFNTIRLSIYDQKEEVKIQRLVGAPNWYIRGPFIVQAALAGIVAAVITIFVFSIGFWILAPKVNSYIPELDLFALFRANLVQLIVIEVVVGMALGIFSSTIAIRKYLKV
jgi:cell division transport system permease protein